MVHPESHRVSRALWYLGVTSQSVTGFVYVAITLYGMSSQTFPLPVPFVTLSGICRSRMDNPATPTGKRLQPITSNRFGLFAPSLAATEAISFDFFSCGYLDVSVLRVRSAKLCIYFTVIGLPPIGFPHSDTHGSSLA